VQPAVQVSGVSKNPVVRTYRDALSLLRNPKAFMKSRAEASPPLMSTLVNYVAVLAIVSLVLTLIGTGLSAIALILLSCPVIGIVSVIAMSIILQVLAPRFGSVSDPDKVVMFVSYIFTPLFIVGILDIVLGGLGEGVLLLTFVGLLYGLYILFTGIPILLKTPKNRFLPFFGSVFVVGGIFYFILLYLIVQI
jgi:hypothetical protein